MLVPSSKFQLLPMAIWCSVFISMLNKVFMLSFLRCFQETQVLQTFYHLQQWILRTCFLPRIQGDLELRHKHLSYYYQPSSLSGLKFFFKPLILIFLILTFSLLLGLHCPLTFKNSQPKSEWVFCHLIILSWLFPFNLGIIHCSPFKT